MPVDGSRIAGAEAVVDALDDRDGPAVGVGGDAGDGVAGGGRPSGRRPSARRRAAGGARRSASRREVRRGRAARRAGRRGGGGRRGARSRSSLASRKRRASVPAAGPRGSGRVRREELQRREQLEQHVALRVRRRREDLVAEGRAARAARSTSVACAARSSVVMTAAGGAQAGDVARAERAAVEGVDAVARDGLERSGQRRLTEHVALARAARRRRKKTARRPGSAAKSSGSQARVAASERETAQPSAA